MGGIALDTRTIGDTRFIEITQGSIHLSRIVTTIHAHVVFLTQGVTHRLVQPVVWSDCIYLTLIIYTIAKSSIRIQLAIITDEILAVWHCITEITQTAIGSIAADNRFVGCGMGSIRSHAIGDIIAIDSTILQLIILSWVGNHIIILGGTARAAPLGIQRNHGFAFLRILSSNHDDAIGTTGSIKSIGCSILQYGHGSHIVWVDIIP